MDEVNKDMKLAGKREEDAVDRVSWRHDDP